MSKARMKAPANSGGFSAGGVSYALDKTGHADVAHEHINEAKIHGFALIGEVPDAVKETGPKKLVPAKTDEQLEAEAEAARLKAEEDAAAAAAANDDPKTNGKKK